MEVKSVLLENLNRTLTYLDSVVQDATISRERARQLRENLVAADTPERLDDIIESFEKVALKIDYDPPELESLPQDDSAELTAPAQSLAEEPELEEVTVAQEQPEPKRGKSLKKN